MNLADCQRVLLFGGSFDPPHVGHLILPMLAMDQVGADIVAYIPAGSAPHKQDREQTSAEHRLAMLRLALADRPFLTVLTDEIDRAADGKPSFTVNTLEALRERLGAGVDLRLLIGGDMLRNFDQWRQPDRILELCALAVMVRPPDTRDALLAALPAGFDRDEWSPRLLDLPQLDISSTLIRQRIRANKPIAGMTPVAVERYVGEYELYGK